MKKKKLFVAICPVISESVNNEIGQLKKHFASIESVRWVPDKNRHITLKFIGWVEEEKELAIHGVLSQLAKSTPSFNISWGDLGFFAQKKYPVVLWIGVKMNPILENFVRQINGELALCMIDADSNRYTPHMTLARAKVSNNMMWLKEKWMSVHISGSEKLVDINQFYLLESVSCLSGIAYRILHQYNLEG